MITMDGGIEGIIADNRVIIDGKYTGYIAYWSTSMISGHRGFPPNIQYNSYSRVELVIHLDPSGENIHNCRSANNDRRLDLEL